VAQSNEARAAAVVAAMHDAARYDDYQRFEPIPIYRKCRVASGEMAVAYWMVHAPQSLYPAVNGGDAAILFCFVFL
jgi:hypothetical protein